MKNRKGKILAVDDKKDNLIVLGALFDEICPNITYLSELNSRNAVERIRQEMPDIIMLDVVMPELDGYEVCRVVKQDPDLNHIPVVMITAAKTDKAGRIEALDAGADAFLVKPIDELELIAIIKSMFRIKDSEDLKRTEKSRLEEMVKDRTKELQQKIDEQQKIEARLREEMRQRSEMRDALITSEQRFKLLFNKAPLGYQSLDANGRIIDVNDTWCKILGYKRDEVIGKCFAFLLPDVSETKYLERFQAMIPTGKIMVEYEVQTKSGSLLSIAIEGQTAVSPTGSFIQTHCMLMDITAKKQLEADRANERNLLRTLIDNIPEAIYVKDTETRKVLANKRDCLNLGYESEEGVLGKTDFEFFEESIARQFYEDEMKVIRSGKPLFDHQQVYIDDDGIESCFLTSKIPLINDEGIVTGMVGISRDITEERLTQKKLIQLTKGVEQSSASIVITDLQGKIQYVNQKFVDVSGYSRDEVIGENPRILKSSFTPDSVYKELWETIGSGREWEGEFNNRRKNGESFWEHCLISPVKDEDGVVASYLAIKEDITEQRIAQLALLENEKKYRLLFENMRQSFCLIDVVKYKRGKDDYVFETVNPAFEDLLGKSAQEVIGKKVGAVIPFQNETDEKHFVNEILLGGEGRKLLHLKKMGKYLDTWVFTPEEGKLAVIFSDITKRLEAEMNVKKLSVGIEQNPAAVFITDIKGVIEYVNSKSLELSGCTMDELLGNTHVIFDEKRTSEEIIDSIIENIGTGKSWRGEHENSRKDGTAYWESVLVSAIKNDEGIVTNLIIISEDISERKKLQSELFQAKEKAEESDRLKTAFLNNMSHEIRTPLNAIVGFSELMKIPDQDSETMNYYCDLVQGGSDQLLGIINDIINISTIEAGKIKAYKRSFNLAKALESLEGQYSIQIKDKDVKMKFVVDLGPDEENLVSDETKVLQVVTNLITNAMKYTSSGYVECGVRRKNDFLYFWVEDSGLGIRPELHKTIFERFRQGDNAHLFGGNGLGLSISQSYVEIMGGEIGLERSVPNEGSRFFFTLPFVTESVETEEPA